MKCENCGHYTPKDIMEHSKMIFPELERSKEE